MLGMMGLAMMTVAALAVGIGVGFAILEVALRALRAAAAAAEPALAEALPVLEMAEAGNVVSFRQRSTGRLAAGHVGVERAA